MQGEQLSTQEDVIDENVMRQAAKRGRRGAMNPMIAAAFDASRQELSSDVVHTMNRDFINGIDRKPAIFGMLSPAQESPELQDNVSLVQNARTAFANEDTLYAPGRGSLPFETSTAAIQHNKMYQPDHMTLRQFLYSQTGKDDHDVEGPAKAKSLEEEEEDGGE
jgi:hypothetical protein